MNHAACLTLEGLVKKLLDSVGEAEWSGDPDQLKQTRIAARRLRAALDLFGRWLLPKQAAGLAKDLAWLTARLGAVRDLDVMLAHLTGPRLSRDRRLLPLQEQVLKSRHAAEARLRRRLTPQRAEAFATRVRGYQQAISSLQPNDAFRNFAATMLWKRYEQLCRRAAHMDIADLPSVHAVRRAARRFRYDLESLEPWLPPSRKVPLRSLRAAQAQLGRLTDYETQLGILQSQLGQLVTAEARAGVQRLCSGVERRMEATLGKLPASVARLTGPSFRRNLARAVA